MHSNLIATSSAVVIFVPKHSKMVMVNVRIVIVVYQASGGASNVNEEKYQKPQITSY